MPTSNPEMLKNRPRSSANGTKEDEKNQRKRVQNRISQRCAREKKLTQNRNVANFMDLVKKAQAGGHENNTVLVNAYAELMQENDQLNEALLRMRKKLLSISNSSEAAADDPIFEKLLKPRGDQRRQSVDPSDPSRPEPDTVVQRDAETTESRSPSSSPGNNRSQELHPTAAPVIELSGSVEPDPLFDDLGLSNYAVYNSLPEREIIEIGHREDESLESFAQKIDHSFLDSFTMPTPSNFPEGPTRSRSFLKTLSPGQTVLASPDSVFDSFGRLSYVRFMDALERASVIYLCSESNIQTDFTKLHEPATLVDLKLRCMSIASSKMVHDLATVAVRVAIKHSGLGDYVHGVGGASTMEAIMQWRLAPTEDNVEKIPEPFRPTPLQRNLAHSSVIDMLNWAHLRDRLILLSNQDRTLDIDQAVRDILLHTVFEVPHLNLSLSTLDAYYNTIGRQQGLPPLSQHDILRKIEGVASIIPETGCNHTAQYWFEIVREMSTTMQDLDVQQTPRYQLAESHFAQKLGVTRLSGWKLSRKWWEDYAYLATQHGQCDADANLPVDIDSVRTELSTKYPTAAAIDM
ncbi:hypothetical protein HBH70_095930 [Parastagonospora nodorum]|nr:hypothetical protein HBI02_240600 [Parastagonospora nodorum]KAH4299939.1 hypothetical protein HBI01_115520 [Parastagonospora nodorum]KAH4320654.1 hypothetical protein HBI00_225470 [Parastagonospora nodorum]KAH4370570.1 hypothetical protein HBH94_127830 [Parastagonospora nodorum]KAH4461207.1 hypothetical protein HBH90_140450 [Parastagonospora nodorum]